MDWLFEAFQPGAQPDDWYSWVLIAAGHAVLVGGALWVVLACVMRPVMAFELTAMLYAGFEILQNRLPGGSLIDGVTDFAFVLVGAAFLWAAWEGRQRAMCLAAGGFYAAALIGVFVRL